MFHKMPSIVLAAAALAAFTVAAGAQTARHRHHAPRVAAAPNDERPPLTVNRRSFLDPGPVAPVYSAPNYVAQNTIFGRTSDQYFAKSLYGNDLLPDPLRVPGRPQPVLEFETPAYPY